MSVSGNTAGLYPADLSSSLSAGSGEKCQGCGKDLGKRCRKYCSNKCQGVSDWLARKKKFLTDGVWPETRFPGKHFKRLLLEKSNACKICGTSTWLGKPLLLLLDHVDGNSDNWALENLRLICSNCDTQLPTYKNRNRGHGRFSRRQRYAEGKSF